VVARRRLGRGASSCSAQHALRHDLLLVDPDGAGGNTVPPHDDEVAFDLARAVCRRLSACAPDGGGEFARLAVLRRGAGPELLTADDADAEMRARRGEHGPDGQPRR
jgi:hypothetical protein